MQVPSRDTTRAFFESPGLFTVMCIAVTWANAAMFRSRLKRYAPEGSELRAEGLRMVLQFAIYVSAMFLLVGVGEMAGLTGRLTSKGQRAPLTGFDVFGLVLALGILVRAGIWVFVQDGAAQIARHHRMFGPGPMTPRRVKIGWALLSLLAATAWILTIAFVE